MSEAVLGFSSLPSLLALVAVTGFVVIELLLLVVS